MPSVLANISALLRARAVLLLKIHLEGAAGLVRHALRQVSGQLPVVAGALGTGPASALPALPACTGDT